MRLEEVIGEGELEHASEQVVYDSKRGCGELAAKAAVCAAITAAAGAEITAAAGADTTAAAGAETTAAADDGTDPTFLELTHSWS